MYQSRFYGIVNLPEELALTPWTNLGGVYRLGNVLGVGPLLGTWHELFSGGYSMVSDLSPLPLDGLEIQDIVSLVHAEGKVQEVTIWEAFAMSFQEFHTKLRRSGLRPLKPNGTEAVNGILPLYAPQLILTSPSGDRQIYDQAFINLWVWAGRPKVSPSLLNKLFP